MEKNSRIDEKNANWLKALERNSVKGIVWGANLALINSSLGKSEEKLEKLEQFL